MDWSLATPWVRRPYPPPPPTKRGGRCVPASATRGVALASLSRGVGGTVPSLKARANPSRTIAARADGAVSAASALHGISRVGLALPLQGRESFTPRRLAPLSAAERGRG